MKRIINLFCTLHIGFGAAAQAQTHWSMAYPLPTGNGLLGATYGNSLFVAVGSMTPFWPLRMGSTGWPIILKARPYCWTSHTETGVSSRSERSQSTDCGEDSLVVRRSADGMAWTDELISNPGYALRKVYFAMDRFIGIGETADSTEILATSPDGLT